MDFKRQGKSGNKDSSGRGKALREWYKLMRGLGPGRIGEKWVAKEASC
jgi:hypothetical protein